VTFQATIRDVLPEDTDYTRALSHACRLVTYPLAGWPAGWGLRPVRRRRWWCSAS
jgi:hypothetical protein